MEETLIGYIMIRVLSSPVLLLAFLFVIFILHIFAFSSNWYWDFDGLDSVYHFIGGSWSALLFFYIFFKRERIFSITSYPWTTAIFALGFVALIGVGWEFFEFGFDYIFAEYETVRKAQLGVYDIMVDLFSDLIGGAMISLIFIRASRR